MRRRLRLVSTLMLSLLAAVKAGAQASPTATGPGTAIRIGGGVSGFQADYGERHLGGAVGWVDVNPYWRVGFEGEARFLRWHSDNGVTESTYLVGPRIPVFSRRAYEPYVKAMIGGSQFNYPFGYGKGTYLVYAGGAGIDLKTRGPWQIRAIDFEYQRWPQFSFGALSPYGVSAGISYRLARSRTNVGRYD